MSSQIGSLTRQHIVATLTTIGGFLPLILAGGDFRPPLAVVIAGGVGLSLGLGLLVTTTLYRLAMIRRWSRLGRRPGAVAAAPGDPSRGPRFPIVADQSGG